MTNTILIGTPIYEGAEPFFEEYLEAVKQQENNPHILFADNSKTTTFFAMLKSKGLDVIKTEGKDKFERVFASREAIVKQFLAGTYTHLFWVDADVVLPANALTYLLAADKPIVSGMYLSPFVYPNVSLIHPVAYKLTENVELRLPLQSPEIRQGEIKEMHSVGFGCCLIKREVIEKTPLRLIPKTNSTEDILFCVDARKNGFKTFVHAGVLCRHGMIVKGEKKFIDADKYIRL